MSGFMWIYAVGCGLMRCEWKGVFFVFFIFGTTCLYCLHVSFMCLLYIYPVCICSVYIQRLYQVFISSVVICVCVHCTMAKRKKTFNITLKL